MSGGSYDYLFTASDIDDLMRKGEHLHAMLGRLEGLGYAEDAAAETEEIVQIIKHAEMRVARRLKHLADVWKAVEWWDSCDWGESSVKQALAEYREEAAS